MLAGEDLALAPEVGCTRAVVHAGNSQDVAACHRWLGALSACQDTAF